MAERVPLHDWGRDHASLLLFVEYFCVHGHGGYGELPPEKMSYNSGGSTRLRPSGGDRHREWKESFSTRLRGHEPSSPRQAIGHDDWDCLDDFEEDGLVVIHSLINGFVSLTDKGLRYAAALTAHKTKGGNYAGFDWRAVEDINEGGA